MKNVETDLSMKATASLKEEIEKELETKDPDMESAKAALNDNTKRDD